MTLRVLLFGPNGQVGTEVRKAADRDPSLSVVALDRSQADLTDPSACAAAVTRASADVVINAAAYTAVDRAEEEEELATRINGAAPGAMAVAAAARELPFLHISTDYVFDGAPGLAWTEEAPCAPLNAYGRSKRAGEEAVAAAGGPHTVLRTAWVHAAHGGNFVRTMLRVGASRPEINVVADQQGGPTAAHDIAAALLRIAQTFKDGRGVSGVFHFAGAPATSWHGFAQEIFARSGWSATPKINPITTDAWPTPAARPLNSVLDCSKIGQAYGIASPDWRRSLDVVLAELRESDT